VAAHLISFVNNGNAPSTLQDARMQELKTGLASADYGILYTQRLNTIE
jgi:hypothetical protein